MNLSRAQIIAALPDDEREDILSKLSLEEKAYLRYNWKFWARPDQTLPIGDWNTWLVLAGRGFGKTRMGAETVRHWVCGDTPLSRGSYGRIALVAETSSDARDVIVEGESGILACHPKDFRPLYEPSKRRLTWPNGAVATLYNAVEPDQLRGPQHDAAWCDELAKWRYMQDTWDQLQFGLRLGPHPKAIVTTTPRPLPLIRRMMNDDTVHVTRGATKDNRDNLATSFLKQIEERYGGTRLGRQELEGEVLEDIPGALWTRDIIDRNRRPEPPKDLIRIVIAIDPAASSNEDSDETGIVAVGLGKDSDGVARGYVLADASCKGTPEEWAKAACDLYHEYDADRIIAEKNNGGEMVEAVIRAVDRNVPITLVHASRGKRVRAEPISALYEQNRVHHIGRLDTLEDQMCLFSGETGRSAGDSPDRVDALVWGVSALFERITARRAAKAAGDVPYTPSKAKSETAWMAG
jgi:phage terminase large subunit-like protein